MASLMKRTLMFVATNAISFICGLLVALRLLYAWLTKPSGTVFKIKRRPIPPDCLNNPEYGEHKYIQLKNVKLHYVEKGDPSKPLMLFIHGFPEFWYSWRHQIKEFSKDYWVVAPDLRGYGDSEKPEGIKYYKVKYLVDDIKNLIDALERKKVILVGHDWGGVIGWYFVSMHSEMIDTYIIMNSPHPLTFRKHMLKSMTQLRMSWYIFLYRIPFLPEIMMQLQDLKTLNVIFHSKKRTSPYSEEDKEAYRFTFGKPGALTPPINYYRANFEFDSRKLIDVNKKLPPGLLIFGKQDLAIHLDTVKDLNQLITNLSIEVINDATHFVQQDDPETVNKLMKNFLEKLPELKKKEEEVKQ